MAPVLTPLLKAAAIIALLQTADPVERLMWLAETAPHETLVDEARQHPEQARRAFHDLLRASVAEPSDAAGRLAAAYAEAWTDAFLVRRYNRFRAWSERERRESLAADSLRLAGNRAYMEQGVEPALALWRESLERHEALDDTVGVARSLGNIGAAFYALGDLDGSRTYYEESRQLALETGDFAAAANGLTMLATIDKETGDLPRAAERYLRALEMHQRIGALRSVAADRHNLGLLALSTGDLPAAKREFEAAIEVSRRTGYMDDEADHLSSLADVLMAEGQYAGADRLLKRALQLDEETGNRLGAAGVHHSLGVLALARGDYALGIAQLSTALEIHRSMGHDADVIAVRKDLARARAAAGDIRAAILELQQARRAAESADIGASTVADLALAAGDLDLVLNDFAGARDRFAQAEHLYRSLGNYAGVAAAQHGQAYVHAYQDENDEALSYLRRALDTQEALGRARAAGLTRLLMAEVQVNAGDTVAARTVAAEAIEGMKALGDRIGEAAALAVLGDIEAGAGFARTADSLYGVGLSRLEGLGAPDVEWRLLAGRAELARERGRLALAAEGYRQAIVEIERSVEPGFFYSRAAGYLADKWEVYAALAEVERRVSNDGAAFEISERLRAQRLLSLLDQGWISASTADSALVIREQDLRRRMAALTTRLGLEEEGPRMLRGSGAAELSREDAAVALDRARREYAELVEELREVGLTHEDLVRPTVADWSDVAEHLRHDEVLLEYLIADSAAMVFVVARGEMRVVELDEPRGTLADLVGFTRGVLTPDSDPAGPRLWRAPLERLYQLLIEPVEMTGLLDGVRHLVIAPHGELHYLPFQALIDPGGAFLVERFTVSYTPSASVWVRLVERSSRPSRSVVLALAPRVEELPGTRRELEAVRRAYPDAVTLRGPNATEQALRAAAGPFRVLHLATYGVLNRANPLFSYIELNPAGGHDGRLEVHEVFGLAVDADLVVLSACETGLGAGSRADVPAGDDWVGLTRSFLSAGATNVLATLWRVEDQPTAELIARLYGAVGSGASVGEALARAQREAVRDPATASPFYWAGFVLVGDGRGAL